MLRLLGKNLLSRCIGMHMELPLPIWMNSYQSLSYMGREHYSSRPVLAGSWSRTCTPRWWYLGRKLPVCTTVGQFRFSSGSVTEGSASHNFIIPTDNKYSVFKFLPSLTSSPLSFAYLGQETGFLAKHLHQCRNYHSPQPANELLLEVSTESVVVELGLGLQIFWLIICQVSCSKKNSHCVHCCTYRTEPG